MPARMTAETFWSRVDRCGDEECWPWTGSTYGNGYGRVGWGGKYRLVHRIAYTLSKGEIPKGLVIDHICRNRLCCNPAHLRAVTQRTNLLENSESLPASHVVKTHCNHGHPYSGSNIIFEPNNGPNGSRRCRTCEREKRQRYRETRRP